jgi:hypothetical protein
VLFPYVCPEPVLVKRSFLCRNGLKRPFSYLGLTRLHQRVVAILTDKTKKGNLSEILSNQSEKDLREISFFSRSQEEGK